MSLKDKIATTPILTLFSMPVPIPIPIPGALYIFTALQIYFVANLLSFGFWRSGGFPVFIYMILFYGMLIAILILLLLLLFKFLSPQFHIACLVIASIPFGAEIWLSTVYSSGPFYDWPGGLLLLAMLFYYRYGSFYPIQISVLMGVIFSLAFIEHSPDLLSKRENKQLTPQEMYSVYESKAVKLDRKPNIHVIALDSFANSAYVKEFLDIENPADEYLSSLNNSIHAGNMGFTEQVLPPLTLLDGTIWIKPINRPQ